MTSFLAMVVANLKMTLRNKQALFWNLLFPAIFIVMFGSIFGNNALSAFDIGIAGPGGQLQQNVTSAMTGSDSFKVHEGAPEEELAALRNDDRAVVIVFPAEGSGDPITIYSAAANTDASGQIAISAARSVLMDVMGASTGTPIQQEQISTLNASYIDWFMPGIIGMSLMNTGIIGFSTAFAAYRDNGVLRRIKVTPFSLWKFMTARIVASMIFSLISTGLLIGLGMAMFDLTVRGNPLLVIAMIILVSLSMLSIGFAIAAIAKNVESAAGLSNLITFPMMFLSGVFFPITAMPDWMRPLIQIMPLKYGVQALREPMLYGHGVSAIGLDVLVLLAVMLIAMLFSVRFFQWDSTTR